MLKTRSKTKTCPRVNYGEHSDTPDNESSKSEGEGDFVVGRFEQRQAGKKNRSSAGRPPKRQRKKVECARDCQCCSSNKKTRKRTSHGKDQGRRRKSTKSATATRPETYLELDSDDEVATTSIAKISSDNIKNKLDSFFKAFESDDDEPKEPNEIPPKEKTKDFYTILSDSEEEKSPVKKKVNDILDAPASTSGVTNILSAGLKVVTNSLNLNPEKTTKDLFAYVDELLNECNQVVDLTNDKTNENVPVLSLEDLKKKTDEILGGVASLINDIKPKPKEPEKKSLELPIQQAPACPVCLEQLGGLRQAMATLCGHMFCESCLLQVIKSSKKCPSCRKPVTKRKYHPVYL